MSAALHPEPRERMSPLERVVAALTRQTPDRVPCAPLVCGASCRVLGYSYARWSQDPGIAVASLLAAQELIGFDGFLALVDLAVEAEDFGQELIYPEWNTAVPNPDNQLIKTPDDYGKVKRVDARASRRMSNSQTIVRELVKARGAEVPTMGFVYGPLGVLSQMRGAADLFKDLIRYPDRVLEAIHTINDVLMDHAMAQIEAGCHAMVLDPLFSAAGVLAKDTWIKFEGEIFKSIADAVADAGVPIIAHNCGLGVYFDAVIDYMKPLAMSHAHPAHGCASWEDHAATWFDKVVTVGYSDPAKVGHEFTQEQVIEDCRKQIDLFGRRQGGFIMSTGCEYPPNGNLLSARTMVRTCMTYGRYQ